MFRTKTAKGVSCQGIDQQGQKDGSRTVHQGDPQAPTVANENFVGGDEILSQKYSAEF